MGNAFVGPGKHRQRIELAHQYKVLCLNYTQSVWYYDLRKVK